MNVKIKELQSLKTLLSVAPRENIGRDTISRYRAQFRAAAVESLLILTGEVELLYCDLHDDFVTSSSSKEGDYYCFTQVKTKKKSNHLWTVRELFGVKQKGEQDSKKISNSFIGRLLMHAVNFPDNCLRITFATNIHLSDEVNSLLDCITQGKTIEDPTLNIFIKNYTVEDKPLSESEVVKYLSRLEMKKAISYLQPESDDFTGVTSKKIFDYSEIDLSYSEVRRVTENLLALVERKSSQVILANISENDLISLAGINLDDLLSILCISKGAYQALKLGGDDKALKSASILQRKLNVAGASEEIMNHCSKVKIEWDRWYREKRHIISEFDMVYLQGKIDEIVWGWKKGEVSFSGLRNEVEKLMTEIESFDYSKTLTTNLLFGALLSGYIRIES